MANNKKSEKNTFLLRCDFYPQIKRLEREQRGDLLDAIFTYASGADIPQMDGVTSMCFEFIRASMDFYAAEYNSKCLTLKENGQKGGRPKKIADGFDETKSISGKPNESKKTKRFLSEAGGSNETESFCEEPNESKKTKNPPFPPYTPLSPRESETESENTHTVRDRMEGVVGGTAAAPDEKPEDVKSRLMARNLIAWIEANVPTVAAMDDPISEDNAMWMLRKYPVEDIRRIILAMHNKRAYRNVNAYVTFGNFARRDIQINGATANADTPAGSKMYTFDEVCDLTPRGVPWGDIFEKIQIDGRPMWRRKTQTN